MHSKAFFLLAGIIAHLFLLSCSCAKIAQNNTNFRDSARISTRQDSINERKSHYSGTYAHDSVFKHDSVLVFIKGDTVIKERWHTMETIKWKTVTKTDTIVGNHYTLAADTVKAKEYIDRWQTKEVEKPDSPMRKLRLFIGDCVLLFVFLVLVEWGWRKVKK